MDAPRRAQSAAPALESAAFTPAQPPAVFLRARSSGGQEEARNVLRPRRTFLGKAQSKWKRSTVPASDNELEAMLEDDPADALEFESLVRVWFCCIPGRERLCALLTVRITHF